MKKQLFPLAAVLAAGLANAQGLGWMEMPQGPTGAVFANTTQTNGTVIVSGEQPNGEWGCNLFDGNLAGAKWCVVAYTGWAVYQFDNNDRWAITNYALRTTGFWQRDPSIWQLEGSNDLKGNNAAAVNAATWKVLDARSFPGSLGPAGRYAFDCANETAYNAYRLNILASADRGNCIEINQWQLYGHSGAAQLWQSAATDAGHHSATLNGWYDKHADRPFEFWVLCDTEDRGMIPAAWHAAGAATRVPEPVVDPVLGGAFSIPVENLVPRETHYARIYAVSGAAEAWSDLVTFDALEDACAVLTLPATDIMEDSATANGDLVYVHGGGDATIRFFWGKQNALETTGVWENEEPPRDQGKGPLSFPLTSLEINTTYYYLFTASNAFGLVSSPAAASFTTGGAPVFGNVGASVFSNAARIKGELASAGSADATVSLWVGPTASGLAFVNEWPATPDPQTFAWLLDPLAPGSTHWYAFKGVNSLDGTWTATNFFTVANATLAWDNRAGAGNGLWDTFSFNWHPAHLSTTGTELFRQGSNVVFPVAGASVTLDGDMDVEHIAINQSTSFAGGRDLWFLHSMRLAENSAATLNAPRLTGHGAVILSNATLHAANPANDFTGGVFAPRGTIHATVAAPASTVLGSGDVALGQETLATQAAALNFTNTAGVPATNSTPGALVANGVFNSGRVDVNNTAARFGSLTQAVPGATLMLARSNNGALLLDAPPAGVFPPWFTIADDNGSYAVYKNGVASPANAADLAAHGHAWYEGGSLAADTNVVSALFRFITFNLAGRTLTLRGMDGAAGVIMREAINDYTGGGAIDLLGNDFYVCVQGNDRSLHPPLLNAGGNLYKFGSHGLTLCNTGLPPRIIAQESGLVFDPVEDYEYQGQVYSISFLRKAGPKALALCGRDGVVLETANLTVNEGRLTLSNGAATVRNVLMVETGARLDIVNTVLNLPSASAVSFNCRSGNATINILEGGVVHCRNVPEFGGGSPGKAWITIANGGQMFVNNRMELYSPGGATLSITNNGSLVSTSAVNLNTGVGHLLQVNNASLQAWSLTVGPGAQSHFGTVDVQDGGMVHVNGNSTCLHIGSQGSNNTVRVRAGGILNLSNTAGTLAVGHATNLTLGNALIPAGGAITNQHLTVNERGVLAPEIQLAGFGQACGLGEIHARGTVTLANGSILRPSAVKGAPGGTYRVLTSPNNIVHDREQIIFEPDSSGAWEWWVDNSSTPKALYVKLSKIGTILMVR